MDEDNFDNIKDPNLLQAWADLKQSQQEGKLYGDETLLNTDVFNAADGTYDHYNTTYDPYNTTYDHYDHYDNYDDHNGGEYNHNTSWMGMMGDFGGELLDAMENHFK